MLFPNSEIESALHRRILAGDPVAPADLFAHFVEPLMSAIRHDLRCDAENARDSSIDALFDYLHSPSAYSPNRGRLCTFLTQIAKHKAVDRIRARSAEVRREQEFSSLVEVMVAEDLANATLVELQRRAWHMRSLTFMISQRRGSLFSECETRLVELLGNPQRFPKDTSRRPVSRKGKKTLKARHA